MIASEKLWPLLRSPLRTRWWITLIVGSGLVRVLLTFGVAPADAVSPDEHTYILALRALLEGRDIIAAGNELGYGPTIFTGSWILLRTAQVFTWIGLTEVAATRVASISFSVLTALLLLSMMLRSRALSARTVSREIPIISSAGFALLVLAFMPSYQVWSSLGLRDASAILAIVTAVWGCLWLLTSSRLLGHAIGAISMTVGVAGTYMSRSSLAIIVSAAIAIAVLLPPLRGRTTPICLATLALIGGNLLGAELRAFTPGPKFDRSIPVTAPAETSPGSSEVKWDPALPAPQDRVSASGSVLQIVDSRVSNLHRAREGMRTDAESAFSFNYCPPPNGALETLICETAYLPVGVYRFLLTPNVLTVPPDAPSQRSFAALENFVWLGLYLVALMTLVGRYSLSRRMTVFVVLFLAGTTVSYALVSGNEGTAFRHKGQFLWAWCLVIALGYGWRPWVRSLVQRKQPVS